MAWRYEPQYDPDYKDPAAVPEEVKPWIRGEQYVWDGTAHLPNFKEDVLAYWGACLTLARKLVQIFALSLDLDEHYFDEKVTYPGADGVFNYYPVTTIEEKESDAVGLGSHTDLQLFTLLWQDYDVGGLQVLNKEGQWIKAPPIKETIVVNIGDFMMRLCNDLYKSTVHRVYNRTEVERVSMPFFFGASPLPWRYLLLLTLHSRPEFQLRRRRNTNLYVSREPTKIRANLVWRLVSVTLHARSR